MKLPNAEQAVIPKKKVVDYLLSSTHRDGRGKAGFFSRFGFSAEHWAILANALLQHAQEHEVTRAETSPFGTRYVIEGAILSPDGRNPQIRCVWFIETDEDRPRFATAYPLRKKGN